MKIKLIETTQEVDITSSPDYKLKPTLKEPTPMGQKVDNEYKKQTRINQNNISEVTDVSLNEDEKTRKKKIFKLSKMESLVHNDDKLSRIYAKIIQDDPETKFGYHYNETVMNMLFNDYVLNNPQYMEKYKNAVPKRKKRRDKTGINQLIKKGEENMDKDNDEMDDISSEEIDATVNEIFSSLFGGGFDTSKFERQPDQVQPNDLFVFDSNSKKLIDIIPRERIQDFRAKYNDLFNQELVKIANPKNDVEVKNLRLLYKIPTIKFASAPTSLGENGSDNTKQWSGQWGTSTKSIKENNIDSFKPTVSPERFNAYLKQTIMALRNFGVNDKLIRSLQNLTPDVEDEYVDTIKWLMSNGEEPNRAAKIIKNKWYGQGMDETTGSASSGAFSAPLNAEPEINEGIAHHSDKLPGEDAKVVSIKPWVESDPEHMEISFDDGKSVVVYVPKPKVDETTTSASSGQYSSPVAFSKNPKKGRFFKKPIWTGGVVIGEGADYITNPRAFRDYALVVESFNEIEEAIGDIQKYIDNGDKTGYIKTLTNLYNMYKEKVNLLGQEYKEHYNNLMKDISDEINIAKQEQSEFDKKRGGLEENPDYAGGIKADLIGSGQPASKVNNMSTQELENEDGLFKGGIEEHHLHTKDDKIAFILQNDAEGKYSSDSLQTLPDQEVDQIYRDTETAMGLSEYIENEPMDPNNTQIFDEATNTVDALSELGNLLFPSTNMPIEQLKSAAQDILNKFFKNQTPEQAVELLRAKMATSGQVAEEIIGNLNNINMQENYKSVISKRLTESRDNKKVKTIKDMNHEERLAQFKSIYESMIDQNPTTMSMAANNDSSMKNDSDDQVGDQPFPEINEDRKSNSMLNLDRIKSQNAANTKSDNSKEDALSSEKTYGFPDKDNDIHKSEIYPNLDDFYIEQDFDKVQDDMTSFAEIEKEKLAQGGFKKDALENVGDAVREKDFIPKRNATEEEQKKIMLNRGAGMEDIVYDNKPADKFDERMKQDMGDQIYKNRQEKMAHKATAPMYNKDSQPTEKGDIKDQDNKYEKKYNTESVTGVYVDAFGKRKFKEFDLSEAIEVSKIDETYSKLDLSGFGNIYTQKVKLDEGLVSEINENIFYVKDGHVYKTKVVTTSSMNESFTKMKHLMNYNPSKFMGR